MGDFHSSLPLWARRPLGTHDLSFSLGKEGKINKLWLLRKLYQDPNVLFHQIHYSYCNKGREHVMFIKFLWKVSPRSEMMLLNLLMFLFGKQKGTWSLVPQVRWGNLTQAFVSIPSESPLTQSPEYAWGSFIQVSDLGLRSE